MGQNNTTLLTDLLDIQHPIIMAPMFLVSDVKMVQAACRAGITGAIPALNYRTTEELRAAIIELKNTCNGPFGINLIVNKSNFKFEEQLEVCCALKVDYIITSLGNPRKTIERAHEAGVLVFCDVTDLTYAKKVEALGCDALIAVNNEAGGHAGKLHSEELLPLLKANCNLPVISAGGVGDFASYQTKMGLGAAGVSVGTIFIASEEAPVTDSYKEAIVESEAEDIVMTTKLSGTPCTVINTPYVQEVGTKQNWFESLLNKNKRLKKWFKALTFVKGMKSLQNAAFSTTYKTVWCAGPTVSYVNTVKPIGQIVKQLIMPND